MSLLREKTIPILAADRCSFGGVPEGLFPGHLCGAAAASEVKRIDVGSRIRGTRFRDGEGDGAEGSEETHQLVSKENQDSVAVSRRIFRAKTEWIIRWKGGKTNNNMPGQRDLGR